jgi:hypothetical protein
MDLKAVCKSQQVGEYLTNKFTVSLIVFIELSKKFLFGSCMFAIKISILEFNINIFADKQKKGRGTKQINCNYLF